MSSTSCCCRTGQTPIRISSGSREPYWSKGRRITRPGWAGLAIKPKLLCQTTTQPTLPRRRQLGTKPSCECFKHEYIRQGYKSFTTTWKRSPLISLPRTHSTGATKFASGCRFSVGGDFLYIRSRVTGGSSHKASWIVLRGRFAVGSFRMRAEMGVQWPRRLSHRRDLVNLGPAAQGMRAAVQPPGDFAGPTPATATPAFLWLDPSPCRYGLPLP
jgi:hypothetical protein